MKLLLNIFRSVLYILTNIIISVVVAGVIFIIMLVCQRLHFILGLALFFIIWKFLLPKVSGLYYFIAKISPFSLLTLIVAFLFQGGECLAGIVGISISTIRAGIRFSSVVSALIVISMSIALCKYAITGSLSYIENHLKDKGV